MNFSIRASYPENNEFSWSEELRRYKEAGRIEAAFYSTELFLRNVRLEDVVEPVKDIQLQVSSVHMAHAKITDFPLFELVLDKTIQIAKALDCEDIVVHPSKGDLNGVKGFIENNIDKILGREKFFLCWETFTSRKRFLSGIDGIADFCRGRQWHKACYDFSHIHDEEEVVLKQVSKYLDLIKIFHISNRISNQKLQHLPVFHRGEGELDLDFMPILKLIKEKEYNGTLVLEYLPEFHEQMVSDALFLMNKFT